MSTLFDIKPDIGMDICPLCGTPMDLRPFGSNTRTQCGGCAYNEPAGSAQYLAYISAVMVRVAESYGVSYAVLNGTTVRMATCMYSRGMLPLLVDRATSLVKSYDLEYLPLFEHCLYNQHDEQAALTCRVVTRPEAGVKSITTTILILTEVFEEALELTREQSDKFGRDVICMECIPGTAAFGEGGMKESRMVHLLREATQQSHRERMKISQEQLLGRNDPMKMGR